MFPDIKPSTITKKEMNSVISVSYDGGYEQTRERYTRNRQDIEASYKSLTRAERDALKAHYNVVRQSSAFDWLDVDDNITYRVRFSEPIQFEAIAETPNRYTLSIKMRTV